MNGYRNYKKYFRSYQYWDRKDYGVVVKFSWRRGNTLEIDVNDELNNIDMNPLVDYLVDKEYENVLLVMRTKFEAGNDNDIPNRTTYKHLK